MTIEIMKLGLFAAGVQRLVDFTVLFVIHLSAWPHSATRNTILMNHTKGTDPTHKNHVPRCSPKRSGYCTVRSTRIVG